MITDPATDESAAPQACTLAHPGFAVLGEPVFRMAEDGKTPSVGFDLGGRDAVVPLVAIQREFGILDESPDGQVLALIAEALAFVTALRLGDPLPAEVLNGDASWEPEPRHLALAMAKLRVQLVALLTGGNDAASADPDTLLALVEDPAFRPKLQSAFSRAAEQLGLADTDAAVSLMGELAHEIAYIEALRERLLHGVDFIVSELGERHRRWRGDNAHRETLTQVTRLALRAHKQIGDRFAELDAQTGEVLAALRNLQSQRAFLRSNRDWLYRTQRAWAPTLSAWADPAQREEFRFWGLVEATYKFLTPRFMTTKEWLRQETVAHKKTAEVGMVW